MISGRAFADRAELLVSQSKAFLAVPDIMLRIFNCAGEAVHLFLRHIDNMKSQSLRRFAPDSRQLGQLLD